MCVERRTSTFISVARLSSVRYALTSSLSALAREWIFACPRVPQHRRPAQSPSPCALRASASLPLIRLCNAACSRAPSKRNVPGSTSSSENRHGRFSTEIQITRSYWQSKMVPSLLFQAEETEVNMAIKIILQILLLKAYFHII